MDINTAVGRRQGIPDDKLEAIERYADHPGFTERERAAIAWAEMVTISPRHHRGAVRGAVAALHGARDRRADRAGGVRELPRALQPLAAHRGRRSREAACEAPRRGAVRCRSVSSS